MPRRGRRGRGHQLWRAVLGNPIPMNFKYYPVTTGHSTGGRDNKNDIRRPADGGSNVVCQGTDFELPGFQ